MVIIQDLVIRATWERRCDCRARTLPLLLVVDPAHLTVVKRLLPVLNDGLKGILAFDCIDGVIG
jgi:hypothetical protein